MRLHLLSLCILLYLFSFVASLPLPGTSSESNEKPYVFNPFDDPTIPLPGRSKIHVDKKRSVVTAFYGDDTYPYHAVHVELNQQKFPKNRLPYHILPAGHQGENRKAAIKDVPTWRHKYDRDEKLPAIFINPDHEETTTVMYVPHDESNSEGGFMKNLAVKVREDNKGDEKTRTRGEVRANLGWLTHINRGQRMGYEAPEWLNVGDRKHYETQSNQDAKESREKKNKAAGKSSQAAKSDPEKLSVKIAAPGQEGSYIVKAGDFSLRPRIRTEPEKDLLISKGKKKASQMQDPLSKVIWPPWYKPGVVWRGKKDGRGALTGAPLPETDMESRRPPRPRNRAEYLKQLANKADNVPTSSEHHTSHHKSPSEGRISAYLDVETHGHDHLRPLSLPLVPLPAAPHNVGHSGVEAIANHMAQLHLDKHHSQSSNIVPEPHHHSSSLTPPAVHRLPNPANPRHNTGHVGSHAAEADLAAVAEGISRLHLEPPSHSSNTPAEARYAAKSKKGTRSGRSAGSKPDHAVPPPSSNAIHHDSSDAGPHSRVAPILHVQGAGTSPGILHSHVTRSQSRNVPFEGSSHDVEKQSSQSHPEHNRKSRSPSPVPAGRSTSSRAQPERQPTPPHSNKYKHPAKSKGGRKT